MNYPLYLYAFLIIGTLPPLGFVGDPVQDYLSKAGNFPNEKLLEINAKVGPDNTKLILLSTINSPGQFIWDAYAKTDQGYEALTSEPDATNRIDFAPEGAVMDPPSKSLIYFVRGGGHRGALRSIQVVKGKLTVTTLVLMGPGTDDPNWTNYQKYFGASENRVPVKATPFTELHYNHPDNSK